MSKRGRKSVRCDHAPPTFQSVSLITTHLERDAAFSLRHIRENREKGTDEREDAKSHDVAAGSNYCNVE